MGRRQQTLSSLPPDLSIHDLPTRPALDLSNSPLLFDQNPRFAGTADDATEAADSVWSELA